MSKIMSIVRKNQDIPTGKISFSRYELRDRATEYEPNNLENPFGRLLDSIRKYGIVVPLEVVRRTPNEYEVIDGGRRLRAAKHLKLESVPCIVLDISSESEIRKLAIISNLQRLDLTDIEKGHALIQLYENDGFEMSDVLRWLRSLQHDRSLSVQNFGQLAKSLSIPYFQQADLIEIILGANPEVHERMESANLATYKKKMIVQKGLKEHPRIQKQIVTKIKHMPAKSAQRFVHQTVKDLKAGVYEKTKDGNYTLDYEKRKEAEAKEGERLREPRHIYLDVMQDIGVLLNTMTNIAVQQLSPERIRSSKYSRHIAKGLDDRELASLDNKLELLKAGVENMNKAVQDEIDTREQTERLGGR